MRVYVYLSQIQKLKVKIQKVFFGVIAWLKNKKKVFFYFYSE